jgi:hypothetical protein
MQNYDRQETVTTTVSYSMENGVPWAELGKLFTLARNELMEKKKPGSDLFDSDIRVFGDGERINIVFKKGEETTRGKP